METEQHPFWGNIAPDWAGFSAGKDYLMPGFDKAVAIFLGDEFGEDGNEIDSPPTPDVLNRYEQTFRRFEASLITLLPALKEVAFARYQKLYAYYYEDEEQSGEPPLGINTADTHFAYMTDLACIRILDGDTIKLPIYYKIDPEHGLEIKLKNGQIVDIGGIAET